MVGLDPVLEQLPREVLAALGGGSSASAGFTARAAAALALFARGVIDAVQDVAVAVKPNSAFFERFGAAGWQALVDACRYAQRAGLIVVLDVKRGDIGHTAQAYADAFLGDTPDTPGPHVDAVTVNPLLGTESMTPFLQLAAARGKGLFALVRTSNASAGELQDLLVDGEPFYLQVARLVEQWGEPLRGSSGLSSVGAVVGATAPEEAGRLRRVLPNAPFLVPGYGAQGADVRKLRACFLPGGRGAIINSSRAILHAHQTSSQPWQAAIRQAAVSARDELNVIRSGVENES